MKKSPSSPTSQLKRTPKTDKMKKFCFKNNFEKEIMVTPRFTDTSLKRTPHYYGQFGSLPVPGKIKPLHFI